MPAPPALTAVRATLADSLAAAGVAHTVDPATLNPPGVLVGPVTRVGPDESTGCARAATVSLFVVVPAPSDDRAQRTALALLAATLDAVGGVAELVDSELAVFDHKGSALPCYDVTVRAMTS